MGRSKAPPKLKRQLVPVRAGLSVGLPLLVLVGWLESALIRVVSHSRLAAPDSKIVLLAGSALVLLVVAVCAVGVSAFILLRKTTHQQGELLRIQQDHQELEKKYGQVVENVPVGLFTFARRRFQFTNWAWDEQMMRQPSEGHLAAFTRSVHQQDRTRVLSALEGFCQSEEPFQLEFRLASVFHGERRLVARGVPVYDNDGAFQHLLGFTIDVTETFRANVELQRQRDDSERKNELLTAALADIEDNFNAMVESLVKAVEAKDPYTAGHSERVMRYSVQIGEALGLSPAELRTLRMGALIHDIGKIGVPDAILTKPAALSPEEFEIVKRHPRLGYDMVQGIPLFQECAPLILWHHERLDGSGYPDRLRGQDVPVLVRIAAVADMYDAMTSNRAYRTGLSSRLAIDELRREAASRKLDPQVVEALAFVLSRSHLTALQDEKAAA